VHGSSRHAKNEVLRGWQEAAAAMAATIVMQAMTMTPDIRLFEAMDLG